MSTERRRSLETRGRRLAADQTSEAPQQTRSMPNESGGVSDALRCEAERGWAASDRASDKRKRKGQVKVRARAKRREKVQGQTDEIVRLKGKLEGAERQLAQERRKNRGTHR
jgi:hypothetical protein